MVRSGERRITGSLPGKNGKEGEPNLIFRSVARCRDEAGVGILSRQFSMDLCT